MHISFVCLFVFFLGGGVASFIPMFVCVCCVFVCVWFVRCCVIGVVMYGLCCFDVVLRFLICLILCCVSCIVRF